MPRQLFLRLSPFLQAAVLSLFVSVYFLEPSLESPEALTSPQNQRLLQFLPSYWFMAVFNQLNGLHPALHPWQEKAGSASLWLDSGPARHFYCPMSASCGLWLSSRTFLPPLIHSMVAAIGKPPHAGDHLLQPSNVAAESSAPDDTRLLPGPRSEPAPSVMQIGSLGIPLRRQNHHQRIVSFGYDCDDDSDDLLATCGRRASNFSFRQLDHTHHANPANSRLPESYSDFMAGIAPRTPLLLMAAILVVAYPWAPAFGHFLLMLSLGFLLVELCLFTFPKVPFSSSYLSGKAQIDFVFWACVMLIFRLLADGAGIESRMLHHLRSFIGLILVVAIAAILTRYLNESRASSTDDLLFGDEDSSELTSLKLN